MDTAIEHRTEHIRQSIWSKKLYIDTPDMKPTTGKHQVFGAKRTKRTSQNRSMTNGFIRGGGSSLDD